jgi:hypothetical protein
MNSAIEGTAPTRSVCARSLAPYIGENPDLALGEHPYSRTPRQNHSE